MIKANWLRVRGRCVCACRACVIEKWEDLMLKILKMAALSLLVSTGMASAVTISGTASIGGTYTSNTDPLGVGSTITLTSSSIDTTGDYVGATIPGSDIVIVASAGSNAGTTFTFPDFDFEIGSTSAAFFQFGTLLVGGLGTASGVGYDDSASSWVLSIAGDGVTGAFSLYIETPPGSVPTVPLPAGLPLMIGGLAAFGVLRKRATA